MYSSSIVCWVFQGLVARPFSQAPGESLLQFCYRLAACQLQGVYSSHARDLRDRRLPLQVLWLPVARAVRPDSPSVRRGSNDASTVSHSPYRGDISGELSIDDDYVVSDLLRGDLDKPARLVHRPHHSHTSESTQHRSRDILQQKVASIEPVSRGFSMNGSTAPPPPPPPPRLFPNNKRPVATAVPAREAIVVAPANITVVTTAQELFSAVKEGMMCDRAHLNSML
jgi:hypothetical protein